MKITLNERQRVALSMYFNDAEVCDSDVSDDFEIELVEGEPNSLVVNGARLDPDGEWALVNTNA